MQFSSVSTTGRPVWDARGRVPQGQTTQAELLHQLRCPSEAPLFLSLAPPAGQLWNVRRALQTRRDTVIPVQLMLTRRLPRTEMMRRLCSLILTSSAEPEASHLHVASSPAWTGHASLRSFTFIWESFHHTSTLRWPSHLSTHIPY